MTNETQRNVLIRVSSYLRREGVCNGCKRSIVWMETLNGKKMPMNSYAIPQSVGEGYDMYSARDSHWATCTHRSQFDRKPRV